MMSRRPRNRINKYFEGGEQPSFVNEWTARFNASKPKKKKMSLLRKAAITAAIALGIGVNASVIVPPRKKDTARQEIHRLSTATGIYHHSIRQVGAQLFKEFDYAHTQLVWKAPFLHAPAPPFFVGEIIKVRTTMKGRAVSLFYLVGPENTFIGTDGKKWMRHSVLLDSVDKRAPYVMAIYQPQKK